MQPIAITIMTMAEDGLMFNVLAKKNSKLNTPIYGILCTSILAGAFAGLFNIGQLIKLLSIGILLAYIITAICILMLR